LATAARSRRSVHCTVRQAEDVKIDPEFFVDL
jgi:hypothetical protein